MWFNCCESSDQPGNDTYHTTLRHQQTATSQVSHFPSSIFIKFFSIRGKSFFFLYWCRLFSKFVQQHLTTMFNLLQWFTRAEVLACLKLKMPYRVPIRKRAVISIHGLLRKAPELVENSVGQQLKMALCDKSPDVMWPTVHIYHDLIKVIYIHLITVTYIFTLISSM